MATLASAAAQRGRTYPVLATQFLIQRKHIRWHIGRDAGPALDHLCRLLGNLRQCGVTPRNRIVLFAAELGALGRKRTQAAFRGFAALHDVEHDVLKISLSAIQRPDLGLQVLQFPWRRYLARIKALTVTVGPCPYLVDVKFRLGLLSRQVTYLGFGCDDSVTEFGFSRVKPFHLGKLGQGTAAMLKPVKLGIQLGQFEQAQLLLRRCFHGSQR